jgi:hypothetical protein
MHESLENMPVKLQGSGMTARILDGWGGMSVVCVELPAGWDFKPLLEGLPNDLCPCPHWGYVLKGSLRWRYSDGTEEVTNAGSVFYAPPGHTMSVAEESAYLDFSPEKKAAVIGGHFMKKMSEQG